MSIVNTRLTAGGVAALGAALMCAACSPKDPVAELESRCEAGSKAFDNEAARVGFLEGCRTVGKAHLYSSGMAKPNDASQAEQVSGVPTTTVTGTSDPDLPPIEDKVARAFYLAAATRHANEVVAALSSAGMTTEKPTYSDGPQYDFWELKKPLKLWGGDELLVFVRNNPYQYVQAEIRVSESSGYVEETARKYNCGAYPKDAREKKIAPGMVVTLSCGTPWKRQ